MFSKLKAWLKKQDTTLYIRFKNEKVHLLAQPSGETFEDLAVMAVVKKGKDLKVTAIGKAVQELPEKDNSVVYAPFSPFSLEPENFELAEKFLMTLVKKGLSSLALIRPKVIIHPDKSYLSEREEQAYRELALSAGAREVAVYIGKTLEPEDFEQKFVKN